MKTPIQIAEEIKRLADEIIAVKTITHKPFVESSGFYVPPHNQVGPPKPAAPAAPAPDLSFLTGEWYYRALIPNFHLYRHGDPHFWQEEAAMLRTALAGEFEKQAITREAK
jgi:hypothetical protein